MLTPNLYKVKDDIDNIEVIQHIDKGIYRIKSTLDNRIIYYKNNKPVFGLKNFSSSEIYNDNYAVLLSNGYLMLVLTKRIGYYLFSNAIMIFNEECHLIRIIFFTS